MNWEPDWMYECRICDAPIKWGELCEKCADGNDPFFSCDNCGKDLKR